MCVYIYIYIHTCIPTAYVSQLNLQPSTLKIQQPSVESCSAADISLRGGNEVVKRQSPCGLIQGFRVYGLGFRVWGGVYRVTRSV